MIYFIQAQPSGYVKIGVSDDPRRRLWELQCEFPEDLAIVRLIHGDRIGEAWLHKQFAGLRMRGEWFRFSALMLTIDLPSPEMLTEEMRVTGAAMSADGDFRADFRIRVESAISAYKISATRFGKLATGDPGFVFGLRAGRSVSSRVIDRVNAFIASLEVGQEAA